MMRRTRHDNKRGRSGAGMDEACVVNITESGRRRRLIGGALGLAVAAAIRFVVAPSSGLVWSIVEVALVAYGWLGVLQAQRRT